MILVIGAMQSELELLVSSLENKTKLNTKSLAYHGFLNGHELIISITGVGKVHASMALTELLTRYNFRKVINIGLAGATTDYQIGEMVFINEFIQYDFDLTHFDYERGKIPGYEPKRVNHKENILDLSEGPLYTQDRFQIEALPIDRPYLSDMEGAALYMVANKFNANFISIQYVSDHIAAINQEEQYFESELKNGKETIYNFITHYLEVIEK
ncbi:MAG: hypothetical protein ACOX56_06110 [Acholeplasmataceae bacterium]|jgi:adenosylhomocysteine nucleosidase